MKEEKITIQNVEKNSQTHKVLELALEAGRILLKNGAEIFRVEETIWHICNFYKVEQYDAFVLSNGIFMTAYKDGEECFARVKYIPLAGTHLGIITEVNNLSREISAGKVDLEEAIVRLKEIDEMPPKEKWKLILAAGVGSGFFCALLQTNIMACVATFFIGMILYAFVLFANEHKMPKIIINIIGGVIITLLAILAIQLPFEMKMEQIIIGSILPLVPGVAFVNAIRDIADSDFISGIVRMLDALFVFVYIAIGVGCVLSFYEQVIGGVIR